MSNDSLFGSSIQTGSTKAVRAVERKCVRCDGKDALDNTRRVMRTVSDLWVLTKADKALSWHWALDLVLWFIEWILLPEDRDSLEKKLLTKNLNYNRCRYLHYRQQMRRGDFHVGKRRLSSLHGTPIVHQRSRRQIVITVMGALFGIRNQQRFAQLGR